MTSGRPIEKQILRAVAIALLAALGLGATESQAAFVTPLSKGGTRQVVTSNVGTEPKILDTFIDASGGDVYAFTSDDTSIQIDTPFTLTVGGETSDSIQVHDNGFLTLSGGGVVTVTSNTAFPTKQYDGTAVVAAFWDDLYPTASSKVYTLTTGTTPDRVFTVQWKDLAHFDDRTAAYNFEVVFFERMPGEVLLQYGTMTNATASFADGRSATAGFQNGAMTEWMNLSHNQVGSVIQNRSLDIDFDSDRDGLAAAVEDPNRNVTVDTGESDPTVFDTDTGGVGDGAERVAGTDPANAADDVATDTDGDTLSNADEAFLGTSPQQKDTDGDGIEDFAEVVTFGTNPLSTDSDGDLLSDLDEISWDGNPAAYDSNADTDPNVVDTDQGGVSDGEEVMRGLDPLSSGDDSGGLASPRSSSSVGVSSNSIVSVAVDPAKNVHVVRDERSGGYRYSMTSAAGTRLIASTYFDGINGYARYARVFALPDGKVAVVWVNGSSGNGEIGYRLIDPALDPQTGAGANTSINSNNPPTVGNGVVLVQKMAVANTVGTNFSHLDAAMDSKGFIHLAFETQPGSFRSHRVVYYAKIKAAGGGVIVPARLVWEATNPNANSSSNPTQVPVHQRGSHIRISADPQGRAHILFSAYTREPSNGGYGDVWYSRVGATGLVEVPMKVIIGKANAHGIYGVASDGNDVYVAYGQRIQRGSSGDMMFQKFSANGLPIGSPVLVDGPTFNGEQQSYESPSMVIDGTGSLIVSYCDRFNGGKVRAARLTTRGGVLSGPTTLDDFGSSGGNSKRGYQCEAAASPTGSTVAVAWNNRDDGDVYHSVIDIAGNPALGAVAMANVTVANGGTLKVRDPASPLAGAAAVFAAADTTADTWGVLGEAANGGATKKPVGAAMKVAFTTGGAELDTGKTFQVRLPVPSSYSGAPAGLVIMQRDDTGSWASLSSTVDNTTTPVTLTATGTALTTFSLFESQSTLVITSQPPVGDAVVGTLYSYPVTALSTTPVYFSLEERPEGMQIDPSTGLVSWTPTILALGSRPVTVAAYDGFSTVRQSFNVKVVTPPGNSPPMFTSSPNLGARVGQPYTYDAVAIDADLQALTYSLTNAPVGMSVNSSSGKVTWTPSAAQVGSNPVALKVTDGVDSAIQTFSVVVTAPTNTAPVFVSTPILTASVGNAYQYDANATDPDVGQTLTFELGAGPTGMVIDPNTGFVSWTPTVAQLGSNPVQITVNDGVMVVAQTFAVTVTGTVPVPPPANTAPQFTSSPPLSAGVGRAYTYQPTVVDPDNQSKKFSLTTSPSGMTIETDTGRVSWTPTLSQAGRNPVAIQVTDGVAVAAQVFAVEVGVGANKAPVFSSVPALQGTVGAEYHYELTATDADGDAVDFLLVTGPAGMKLEDGTLHWTPTEDQKGRHIVEVHATDGLQEAKQMFFVVVVPKDAGGCGGCSSAGLNTSFFGLLVGLGLVAQRRRKNR